MENANDNIPVERISPQDRPAVALMHPTPNNPHWNSPIAVGVWIASVLAIVFVPMVFVIPYVVSQGPSFSAQEALGEFLQRDTTAIILQILAIIPAHILTLGLAWAIVTRMNRFSFKETLGWQSGGMKGRHYVAVLGVFFVVAIVVASYFPEQENELTRMLQSSRAAVFLVAFMATFTAPIVEEVIYRGILYSAFQRSIGVVAAVVAVTLLFALVHVPQYYPSFSSIFLLLLLSLILTVIRARTANLLPCIILHTIFNATQSVLLILEPYLKTADPVIEPTASFFLK